MDARGQPRLVSRLAHVRPGATRAGHIEGTPPTSAPGPGSSCARICAGTGLTLRPHLRRDRAHPAQARWIVWPLDRLGPIPPAPAAPRRGEALQRPPTRAEEARFFETAAAATVMVGLPSSAEPELLAAPRTLAARECREYRRVP